MTGESQGWAQSKKQSRRIASSKGFDLRDVGATVHRGQR
jgi:hypothetical protein